MSREDFSEVDIDLLADYIGGALDRDDEATVARLVAEDPAWRTAWESLAPGMGSVQASLSAFESEPMPADVISRLDAALTSAISDVTPVDQALVTPGGPRLEPARGERHMTAVPDSSVDARASARAK